MTKRPGQLFPRSHITHSVIRAYQETLALPRGEYSAMTLPLTWDQLKLTIRDAEDEVVVYTECSQADAELILRALRATPENNVTSMVQTFVADGMSFDDARDATRLVVSGTPAL